MTPNEFFFTTKLHKLEFLSLENNIKHRDIKGIKKRRFARCTILDV